MSKGLMDQFHNERNRLNQIVSRYAGRGIKFGV